MLDRNNGTPLIYMNYPVQSKSKLSEIDETVYRTWKQSYVGPGSVRKIIGENIENTKIIVGYYIQWVSGV